MPASKGINLGTLEQTACCWRWLSSNRARKRPRGRRHHHCDLFCLLPTHRSLNTLLAEKSLCCPFHYHCEVLLSGMVSNTYANGHGSEQGSAEANGSVHVGGDQYLPRSILITGGAGFIASHVVTQLLDSHPQYKVCSRLINAHYLQPESLTFAYGPFRLADRRARQTRLLRVFAQSPEYTRQA